MQINGSFPINVARAYGVTPVRTPAPALPAQGAAHAEPTMDVAAPRPIDPNLQRLVGGRVDGSVELTSGPDPAHRADEARRAGVYPLYTRAADRIEAAVGVELGTKLGRTIDVSG
jgi:hypothetical protein